MTYLADLYDLRRKVEARCHGTFDTRLYRLRNAIDRKIDQELGRQARIAAAAALIEVPDDEEPDHPTSRAMCRGGRAIPDIYSEDEARQAHTMFRAGSEEAWVHEAELQYQRNRKRRSRLRKIA